VSILNTILYYTTQYDVILCDMMCYMMYNIVFISNYTVFF